MTRLLIIAAMMLGAGAAHAIILTQYNDDVWLHAHETIRYRVEIDYGTGTSARIDLSVRGITQPPRVRVLDSLKKEVRDVRDTDGDWKLEFGINAVSIHPVYFVEVDSARPGEGAQMDNTITVSADALNDASAFVSIDRVFKDFESGDDSDHYDCVARPATTLWALLPIGGLAAMAAARRRKVAKQML